MSTDRWWISDEMADQIIAAGHAGRDAAYRRVWAAALRRLAQHRRHSRGVDSEDLDDFAAQVESGALTPWADTPPGGQSLAGWERDLLLEQSNAEPDPSCPQTAALLRDRAAHRADTPEPATQPAVAAQETPTDPGTAAGTPGAAGDRTGPILGRALLTRDGHLLTRSPASGDAWGSGFVRSLVRSHAEDLYGAREVLLVSPAAGEVLAAAEYLTNVNQDPDLGVGDRDDAEVVLMQAVDAMVGDHPAEPARCEQQVIADPLLDDEEPCGNPLPCGDHPATAPLPGLADLSDAQRQSFLALAEDRQPAPVPDSGTGWDRSAVEALLARSGADATDHELRQVVALLHAYDRRAADLDAARGWLDLRGGELVSANAQRDAARAELAEVTADRETARHSLSLVVEDHRKLRAELATARRDAEDALEPLRAIVCDPELTGIVERGVVGTSPETYSGVTKDEALDAMVAALRSARDLLDSTRTVPGRPEPATSQEPSDG